MEETGTVIATEPGYVTVRFTRTEACKKCGACKAVGDGEMLMRLRDEADLAVGGQVTVEISGGRVVAAGLLLYGVPLVGLILGLFLGYYIVAGLFPMDAEVASLLTGLLFMGVCLFILRLTEPGRTQKGAFLPKAKRKYPDEQ